MLDNIDGKQARKTGNSTALGSLFDHGCDVVTLSLCMTTVMDLCGLTGTEFYIIAATTSFAFSLPLLQQFTNEI